MYKITVWVSSLFPLTMGFEVVRKEIKQRVRKDVFRAI